MKNFLKTRFGKILFTPPHFILVFILSMTIVRMSAQQDPLCGQKDKPSSIPTLSISKNCSNDFSDFLDRHSLDMVLNGS